MKGMQTAVAAVAAAATIGISGLAQTSAPPAAASAPKTWADKLTFKGDLRYRYESIQDDSKLDDGGDTYTRQRNRIRARLGAEAKIDDQMKAGLELSTGQSDPVSGNQSLGEVGSEMRVFGVAVVRATPVLIPAGVEDHRTAGDVEVLDHDPDVVHPERHAPSLRTGGPGRLGCPSAGPGPCGRAPT